jgi:hypothetical protein
MTKEEQMQTGESFASVGPLPGELINGEKRRVRLCGSDARTGLVVGLLLLFFGAYGVESYFAEVYTQVPQRAILRSEGKDVEGTVKRVFETRRAGRFVEYSFSEDGQSYFGKAQIPRGISTSESEKIAIRYLPSDPTINHPAAWEWSAARSLNVVSFAAFFTIAGIVILLYLWRERQILSTGVATWGVVNSCELRKRIYRVSYSFRTDGGEQASGISDSTDPYEVGENVVVVYIRQSPRRNRVYPLVNFNITG